MPTTPPSWLQRQWAYLGSDYGMKDVSALASAAGGIGSLAQGFATRANAKLAGELAARDLKRYYRRARSKQVAQYAKAGVLPQGTPLDVITGDYELLQEDLYANQLRVRAIQKQALISGVAGLAEGLGRANVTLLSKRI